jgi:hypothetical protein
LKGNAFSALHIDSLN